MRLIHAKNYDDMSLKAANIIAAQMSLNPKSVLGLATGSTPIGTYRHLVEWYQKGELDFGKAVSINLDEYCGLSGDHPQSYRRFMRENLFDHINIPADRSFLPDGTQTDSTLECARYDRIIEEHNGIDLQLLGIGRTEKFSQIMTAMGSAFFTRRICLLGGGIMAVAVITMVAAAAFFAAEKGPARRRVLMAHLAFAFCFAALYAFHLILYYYNFSDVEGLALKDYDRYLSPYYQAWMLARSAAARWSCCVLACAAAAVVGIFCWRGIPAAGFWSDADSLYTLRADVQDRADTMNTVLDWPDRVLVLSQGDDATRWYYYRYELTAQVVNGFGGFYGRLGETQDRWDSDFMNLVESENWTLYDYKAVCVPATLVAYMQEKDCDYLLIDRADDYLQREFSPYFEGGLTADMPATLYHFEGADAAVPFTLAAVAESGVE